MPNCAASVPPSRIAAWDNPAWVLAVMHYPRELTLLERIATGTETMIVHAPSWHEGNHDAARAGKVAGNVLAVLYALSRAPWGIPEPSFAKAVSVVERLAYEDRHRGAPRGHTKIESCFDRMRAVAHLWAAMRLHWEYPVQRHEELMRTDAGIRTLLGIARGVQEWALDWTPSRAAPAAPLLGHAPWLIPDDIPRLLPPWAAEPPPFLARTLNHYRRRKRGR